MALNDALPASRREFFPRSARPYIGIIGVLVGTVISTLSGRITTFGLADIRGAVHAGFDE